MKLPIFFALLTGLFWGTYGSALAMSRAAEKSPFKPYVLIGVAYLVWGIVGGVVGMMINGDKFSFTLEGSKWGFIAGSLGAFGALALTAAMYSFGDQKPQPHIVMSVVFGSAVVVSAITATLLTGAKASPMLYVGIVGMAICIVIVASNTPHAAPKKTAVPGAAPATATATPPAAH